jgi:hypothetical protein
MFASKDNGYSNWTVLDTTVSCMKGHFEETEESYSWKQNEKNPEDDSEFFKRAETCPDYIKETGTQVHLDVDGYTKLSEYKDDPEVYAAALSFFGEDYDSN